MGRNSWRWGLGLAFSLAFIFLALRDVDLTQVGASLLQADMRLLAMAAASFVATVLAKAARWRLLFALRREPPLGRCFSVLAIGMMVNAFVPARLGELVRAYLIGEAEGESKVYALGTIAVEKVSDLGLLVAASVLLLAQMSLPQWLVGPSQATAVMVAVAVLLCWLAVRQNDRVLQGLGRVVRFLPGDWGARLVEQAGLGLASLKVVQHPRLLAGLLLWTLLVWLLGMATNYVVFLAMGLSLSLWAALFLLVVLQAGVAVPSSPGKVGVFHYLTMLALAVFGVEKEVALGYAVILHLVVYVPMALLGIYGLWREKVAWEKVSALATRLGRPGGEV